MYLRRLLASAAAVLVAACGNGKAEQRPVDENVPQATLPEHLCDLVPQPDAERIMGKALVQERNDGSGCHYQDARGTAGTGLWIFHNVLQVGDQCRLTPGSEPLSGLGGEACMAPEGMYTHIVFSGGGQTFEVIAPGKGKASELATAVAKVMLSKLGS
jgi:hypothetical protein